VFNRQRRRQERQTQLLRARLDKLESETPPTRAIEHLEGTISTFLQHSESAQAARDATVVHLWHKVIDQEHDVNAAVQQLVSLCASLTERLEAQDREQQELLDVIRVLAQKLELPSNAATPGLLGDVIDITELSPPPLTSEQPRSGFDEQSDHDEPRRGDGWQSSR
jgi:hypothetical protein